MYNILYFKITCFIVISFDNFTIYATKHAFP